MSVLMVCTLGNRAIGNNQGCGQRFKHKDAYQSLLKTEKIEGEGISKCPKIRT